MLLELGNVHRAMRYRIQRWISIYVPLAGCEWLEGLGRRRILAMERLVKPAMGRSVAQNDKLPAQEIYYFLSCIVLVSAPLANKYE